MTHGKGSDRMGGRRRRPTGLNDVEIAEIREAFDVFDTEGLGTIDVDELRECVTNLGTDAKHRTLHRLIDGIDASHPLTFDEFLDVVASHLGDPDDRAHVDRIFRLFDDDGTGYITLQNLRRIATDLGETMSDAELLEMIERADTDRDGQISPDEFYGLMTKRIPS